MSHDSERILRYWFGKLDAQGYAADDRNKLWFQSDSATDDYIRSEFGDTVEQALAGELDHFADTPRGRLALIILLDQFTRNIYRGSSKAFSGDHKACTLTKQGLTLEHDQALAPAERVFFYIPLEHSENLADQKYCVALYQQMLDQAPPEHRARVQSNLDYAIKHQEIIEQFGRFPHRNKVLARTSTPQEQVYLENANTFGQ